MTTETTPQSTPAAGSPPPAAPTASLFDRTSAPAPAIPAVAPAPPVAPAAVIPPPEAPKAPDAPVKPPEAAAVVPPEAAKPGADTAVKPPEELAKVVPEKYDLKVPKDSPLTAKHIEEFAKAAKENGLSNEEAQGLLERDHEVASQVVAAKEAEFVARKEAWKQEVIKDPEIGGMYGAELKSNIVRAQQGLARFASASFMQMLETTGLGNHPEMVRMGLRIDKASANDRAVMVGGQNGVEGKKSAQESLYGGTKS